jgi:hypothetical protein
MVNKKNSELMKTAIQSVYKVAGRRTSERFADDTIKACLLSLSTKYEFLKDVTFTNHQTDDKEKIILIHSDIINKIDKQRIVRCIESLIRMVYDELNEEAGLYFITELKEKFGKQLTQDIENNGIDLDQIQLEQHHVFERRLKKKKKKDGSPGENKLGYNWKKVSSWQHEEGSKFCTLYDDKGNVLDRLNLDSIIQNYVETLSGEISDDPESLQKKTKIFEKEYNLLELMHKQDMDADTAIRILKVSKEELIQMIKKLSNMEMIKYVSDDTLELTSSGAEYVESQIKQ